MTDAVILVGGRGKRLGKLTVNTPKPLIKIKGIRFIDILISKLIKYEFQNIYLICSYKKEKFFKLYHNKKIHNSKIICIDEGLQKDTAGGLFKLKKKIKKSFFLFNGDSFFDLELNLLPKILKKKNIAVVSITDSKDYKTNNKMNNLIITRSNIVQYSKFKSKLMNAGIYYFKKKIFDYLSNKKISLENDILKNLIFKKKVSGLYTKNKFIDIGTFKNLNYIKKNPNYLKQKAFFLDRDGVINKLKKNDYIKNFSEFKLLPGVAKGIKLLNNKNYIVIIATNQAGIGKSIISEKILNEVHYKMKKKLHNINKAKIDDIYYSPYYKFSKNKKYRKNFYDRKPSPGMFVKAIKKWNIDLNKSFFIGDTISDFNASKKIELKFYYRKKGSLLNQLKEILK